MITSTQCWVHSPARPLARPPNRGRFGQPLRPFQSQERKTDLLPLRRTRVTALYLTATYKGAPIRSLRCNFSTHQPSHVAHHTHTHHTQHNVHRYPLPRPNPGCCLRCFQRFQRHLFFGCLFLQRRCRPRPLVEVWLPHGPRDAFSSCACSWSVKIEKCY